MGRPGSAAALSRARVSVFGKALGPLTQPAHLRQVLVVEQMRLAGLEAVLTLTLVENIGLEFPARILLGCRHDQRGGGEAQRPGPARAPRRTVAGGAAAPCTVGSRGSGRAQRGRRGMPRPAAASQPGRGSRPERAPGGEGGLAGAGMRPGPFLVRRRCAARRAQAPQRRAPRPGPSESAQSLPPTRTAAARPPRAHGRGLPGPLPLRARARLLGAESLPIPAVGPCRRCPRRPRPQQMVAERLIHSRGGVGGPVPQQARGRREGEGPRAGWGRAHDAIGGSVDQW